SSAPNQIGKKRGNHFVPLTQAGARASLGLGYSLVVLTGLQSASLRSQFSRTTDICDWHRGAGHVNSTQGTRLQATSKQNAGATSQHGTVGLFQLAPSDLRIFQASGSLTSECRGTASTTPVRGLVQSECELPSRLR